MKPDPILEEIWRIKDELSREMETNASAHDTRIEELIHEEEIAGRKIIRSLEELRRFVKEENRKQKELTMPVLKEKAAGYGRSRKNSTAG